MLCNMAAWESWLSNLMHHIQNTKYTDPCDVELSEKYLMVTSGVEMIFKQT